MSRTRNFSQSTKATEKKRVEQMTKEEVRSEIQRLREQKRTQEVMAKHSIDRVKADLAKAFAALQQTASKKIEAVITESSIRTAEVIEMQEKLQRRKAELQRMEEEERYKSLQEQQKTAKVVVESLSVYGIHHSEHLSNAQIYMKYDPSRYSHRKKKEPRSLTSKKH